MEKLSPKERIEKVVCWAGFNTSAFATHIGLSSPQTLYQIKASKYNISRSLAERICRHYPELDFAWLFSGEGEMLRAHRRPVPHYLEDCRKVAQALGEFLSEEVVVVAGCGDCAFAAPLYSDAMEPDIKQGSLLFCAPVAVEELQEGGLYLVVARSSAFVGRLLSLSAERLMFGCGEPVPTLLDPTQIKALYRIKAVLEWKNI
jgi:hypothetical protein